MNGTSMQCKNDNTSEARTTHLHKHSQEAELKNTYVPFAEETWLDVEPFDVKPFLVSKKLNLAFSWAQGEMGEKRLFKLKTQPILNRDKFLAAATTIQSMTCKIQGRQKQKAFFREVDKAQL